MNTFSQSAVNAPDQCASLSGRLRASRDRVLQVLAGVSEQLGRVRPAENSWSILDCAEHIALAERAMFSSLERRAPAENPADPAQDAEIESILLDRSRKRSAPERVRPAEKFPALSAAIDDFCSARERTLDFVQHTNEDLRKSTARHPFGVFDCHQFVLIMALHAERHARQIEEIKYSDAYRAAEAQLANRL